MAIGFQVGPSPLTSEDAASPQDSAAAVRRFVQMMWSSAAVQAAAELGLADGIDDEPVSVTELAAARGLDEQALLRLMRALAAHGIFEHAGDHRFVHTAFSRALRSDSDTGVLSLTLLAASGWNWAVWGDIAQSVRTGKPAFVDHFGVDLYSYFSVVDPEAGAVFDRAMSESGQWTTPVIAAALDLDGVSTVVDVGGGQGGLLRQVLASNPEVRGVLVDRPEVIEGALPELRDGDLAARCTLAPANIVDEVPGPADLFVLRQVMHIWDDETCEGILRNCASVAAPGARLALVEHVVVDDVEPNPTFTTLIDLTMMLIGSGRERTIDEFTAILDRAGWVFEDALVTRSPFRIITASLGQ